NGGDQDDGEGADVGDGGEDRSPPRKKPRVAAPSSDDDGNDDDAEGLSTPRKGRRPTDVMLVEWKPPCDACRGSEQRAAECQPTYPNPLCAYCKKQKKRCSFHGVDTLGVIKVGARRAAFFNGKGYTPAKRITAPQALQEAWTKIRDAEDHAVAVAIHNRRQLAAEAKTYGLFPDAITTPWDRAAASVARLNAAPPKPRPPVARPPPPPAVAGPSSSHRLVFPPAEEGADAPARDHYVAAVRREYNEAVAQSLVLRHRIAELQEREMGATGLTFGAYRSTSDSVVVPPPLDVATLERVGGAHQAFGDRESSPEA
ncbi:hypothetical protein L227DRAFT_617623, partial [Lentinus tigrinus ALCF2SS1-6]